MRDLSGCLYRRAGFDVSTICAGLASLGLPNQLTIPSLPVAGAQYHWTYRFAPVAPLFCSFVQGAEFLISPLSPLVGTDCQLTCVFFFFQDGLL